VVEGLRASQPTKGWNEPENRGGGVGGGGGGGLGGGGGDDGRPLQAFSRGEQIRLGELGDTNSVDMASVYYPRFWGRRRYTWKNIKMVVATNQLFP